ncbi:MAG: hypothetical protein AB1Z98_34715 [Nannocystaceae bacterium]
MSPSTPPYAPFYCEENIWQLSTAAALPSPRAVLVISNPLHCVAIAHQRIAPTPGRPIVWDYHVILAAHTPTGWAIWDLDTTLGVPVPLGPYLRASFAYPDGFPPPFDARFRVVPAERYRQTLCTDRSHMLDEHGQHRAAPPPWPAIGTGTNLMRFVDTTAEFEGEVVPLTELPAALDRLLGPEATRSPA